MRRVQVFRHDWSKDNKRPEKTPDGEGFFHQFGISFCELEHGPAHFTTAVVEMPDGTIKEVDTGLIRFLDRPGT